ncbi:MAG: hypothetical protein ACRDY7_10690, partial [Acidimicrobiia bacterium]
MERQFDPRSAAFTARGHLPFPANVTHRNWTMVGNLGRPEEPIVDPRGLVTPWFDGWSLDWWVGAGDRWHLPSREPAVRQSLAEGSVPVVETAMRIPGGDALARVYAVMTEAGLAVVEVENRSPTPVAVAFALRPYNPEGLAAVERIMAEGLTVLADGRPALFLPRPPGAAVTSTLAAGDCVHQVTAGATGEWPPAPVRDKAGLAQAAFVYAVPHHTSIRVAIPLVAVRRSRSRSRTVPPRRVARLPKVRV